MYKWQLLQAAVISSVAGVLTLLVQIDIYVYVIHSNVPGAA